MQGLVDYVGQKIGKLVVEDILPPQVYKYRNTNRRYPVLKVRCECGRERAVRLANLKSGNTTSCGCCVKIGNQSKKKKTNKMNFQVVTVSNRKPHEWYYTYDEFFISLGSHKPVILGTKVGEYMGLASKPKLLLAALQSGAIKSDYIIFADSWDIVFAAEPDELLETYFAFNSPIVISAERNCFPATFKDEYDKLPATSSYKYLNSGMIVAESGAMLALLESMDLANVPNDHYNYETNKWVHPNDQELYQEHFLKQPVKIALDYDQILCNTLHSTTIDDLNFNKNRIQNNETKSYPCSFHLNGNAKSGVCREPILRHLKLM